VTKNTQEQKLKKEVFQVSAPAKVNLSLIVKGKRADGYHELISPAIPITLEDVLKITVDEGDSKLQTSFTPGKNLSRGQRERVKKLTIEKENSLTRAWHWWTVNRRIIPQGWNIEVEKNIPIEAGLGGGTADGAAFLKVLSERMSLPLPKGDFVEPLGSDMAFCLRQRPGWIRGRGEIVKPLKLSQKLELCLAAPDFGISSNTAYENLDIEFHSSCQTMKYGGNLKPFDSEDNTGDNSAVYSKITLENILNIGTNCLWDFAQITHPTLNDLKNIMSGLGAYKTGMTGSGPTIFGVFPSKQTAHEAAMQLTRQGFWACAVSNL